MVQPRHRVCRALNTHQVHVHEKRHTHTQNEDLRQHTAATAKKGSESSSPEQLEPSAQPAAAVPHVAGTPARQTLLSRRPPTARDEQLFSERRQPQERVEAAARGAEEEQKRSRWPAQAYDPERLPPSLGTPPAARKSAKKILRSSGSSPSAEGNLRSHDAHTLLRNMMGRDCVIIRRGTAEKRERFAQRGRARGERAGREDGGDSSRQESRCSVKVSVLRKARRGERKEEAAGKRASRCARTWR